MYRLTAAELNEMLHIRREPCVSIYLPVEKVGQDTRQGAIRLRKLIKASHEALRERGLRTPQAEQLLSPVQALVEDALFWEHQEQGLALFASQDSLKIHQLIEKCAESVTISDRFMVLPLLAESERDQAYYLLSLSLDGTRLYLGTRASLTECELAEPRSVKSVRDTYTLEKQLQHHGSSGSGGTVYHGSETAHDKDKLMVEEFLRQMSANLAGSLTLPDAPLVVACVDYLFPIFRSLCKDCRLQDTHISGSPDTLKKEVLTDKGWQIARPFFEQGKHQAIRSYGNLAGTGKTSIGIGNLLPLALQGRVDTLLLSRQPVWGRWDASSGAVLEIQEEQAQFGDPDLLSVAALLVLEHGGTVFLLHDDEMPVSDSCAGLLRF
ncbi:MAG: hypothetical protein PHG76_06240 [Eubacteriales bacterium]|nr:hypothetical protein [Eubacteriales bacterium]